MASISSPSSTSKGRSFPLRSKAGLTPAKFLEIASAVADAVRAAHEAGVIHRDLKPDNVMLTKDGRVKVLDFGLAKARADLASTDSKLPTLSATDEGRIVGTAAYLSPEQAAGKPVDVRTDTFSLGIVLTRW